MEKIKLLLINDFLLLRESLAALLHQHAGIKVVGQTGYIEEALQLSEKLSPHVVLLDLNMQPLAIPKVARLLRKVNAHMRVIVFTTTATHSLSMRLVRMPGITGYLTKESSTKELLEAIEQVYNNHRYLSRDVREAFVNPINGSKLHLLTKRETEIVSYIRKGLRSKEIGESLDIALKTVEIHRYNILRKLHLKNTAALVNYINKYE